MLHFNRRGIPGLDREQSCVEMWDWTPRPGREHPGVGVVGIGEADRRMILDAPKS